MERALADLRASGWSEDRLKAALGDEYVPPAGTASTSGQQQQPSPSGTYEPDLGWQNVPQIKELTPTELADVDAATKDVFELLAVPLDLAASTARTICASADHYDNLPESQRELYTRTEEHWAEQTLPGCVARVKARIAAAVKADPWAAELEKFGAFRSRQAIVALGRA